MKAKQRKNDNLKIDNDRQNILFEFKHKVFILDTLYQYFILFMTLFISLAPSQLI